VRVQDAVSRFAGVICFDRAGDSKMGSQKGGDSVSPAGGRFPAGFAFYPASYAVTKSSAHTVLHRLAFEAYWVTSYQFLLDSSRFVRWRAAPAENERASFIRNRYNRMYVPIGSEPTPHGRAVARFPSIGNISPSGVM
jgi:hypothetical protein